MVSARKRFFAITFHVISFSVEVIIFESLLTDGVEAMQNMEDIHSAHICLGTKPEDIFGVFDCLFRILA